MWDRHIVYYKTGNMNPSYKVHMYIKIYLLIKSDNKTAEYIDDGPSPNSGKVSSEDLQTKMADYIHEQLQTCLNLKATENSRLTSTTVGK